MTKKLILFFLTSIICFWFIISEVYSEEKYDSMVGAQVFAIADGLFLGTNGYLYICTNKNDKYVSSNIISPDINTRCKGNKNINSCNSATDIYCYAGWIFDIRDWRCHVDSRDEDHCFNIHEYKNKWFSIIGHYPELSKVILMINNKFFDIFSRLNKAQTSMKHLSDEYSEYKDDLENYDEYMRLVDSDIKQLSKHGFELAAVTKKLFSTIKPIVIDAQMHKGLISGRKKSMVGLRSFEKEMNKINALPTAAIDESISQIINSIDKAIEQLERTLSR